MPRNRKRRRMGQLPGTKGFRPVGQGHTRNDPVILALEEYETIRLTDYNNMSHLNGAELMHISRSTYTRIYEAARKKVGISLVEGRPLIIEGGSVEFSTDSCICLTCGTIFTMSPLHSSLCPNCGSEKIKNRSDCFTEGCSECSDHCFSK